MGGSRLPARVTWGQLVGASLLCGIGFTMSLFIAGLAFSDASHPHATTARLGIMVGTLLASVLGTIWLARALPKIETPVQGQEPGDFLTGWK